MVGKTREGVLGTRWKTSLFLLYMYLVGGGCETTSVEEDLPVKAPTANVNVHDAVRLASLMKLQNPELLATLGGGQSMEPLYTENTVILLAPIAYEDLQLDMVVAYESKNGHIVTHQLIRKERNGWLARGANNPNVDAEKVTPNNLRGVVYGVIYTGEE